MSGKPKEYLNPIKNLNPFQGWKHIKERMDKLKPKMPKVAPIAPPVSMRSQDVIDMEEDTKRREAGRKGLGATILGGAFRAAGQPAATIGTRSLLGSVKP